MKLARFSVSHFGSKRSRERGSTEFGYFQGFHAAGTMQSGTHRILRSPTWRRLKHQESRDVAKYQFGQV